MQTDGNAAINIAPPHHGQFTDECEYDDDDDCQLSMQNQLIFATDCAGGAPSSWLGLIYADLSA